MRIRIVSYILSLMITGMISVPSHAAPVTVAYTYAAAGRLTRADYGGGTTIDYVYDANGNLLQRIVTGDGEVTYTLIYRAGTGGSIDGVATQIVAAGESGAAVSAVVEDAGAVFGRWSDGNPDLARTDTDVQTV